MNRSQRIVLVLYCLLIVYCCVWIPWHVVTGPMNDGPTDQVRVGYGWLWSGPSSAPDPVPSPDLPIIGLRLLAASAIAGAAFAATLR
jgi:hypothetical protein